MKGLFKIVLVSSCLVLLWNPLGSCNEGAELILSLDLRTFGYRRPLAERDFRDAGKSSLDSPSHFPLDTHVQAVTIDE